MARLSTEARAGIAGLAAVGLLAACSSSAPPDRGANFLHPKTGIIRIFAGFNGETQTIPPGAKRHIIVTFTPPERKILLSGEGTVVDQITGTGWSAAVTPRSGLRQEVSAPASAGKLTSRVIIRA